MAQPAQMSAAGLALLKASEGFRASAYLDAVGFLTIGYGHRILPTEAQASTLLAADVVSAQNAVLRLVHVPLTQGQFDALVDFTYNLGAGKLSGSTLLRDLNAGQYAAAACQLLLWDHAGPRELAALKSRREAEFNLWQGKPPAA